MNYRKLFLLLVGICICFHVAIAQNKTYIIPDKNQGNKLTSLNLNGDWQFKYSPKSKWTSIKVPGEAAMQGFAIEHDKTFIYKKTFTLPRHFDGKNIILRFDGVYSHAKLYVNNEYVREHYGGFTRWEADITAYVKQGKSNEIRLEVTDKLDDISYASGYAHHPIGGILRDVSIFALPDTYIHDFYVETILDSLYTNATLKIGYAAVINNNSEIEYQLTDAHGKQVLTRTFALNQSANNNFINEIPVENPLKWDAEHPNLYKLTASIKQNGAEISRYESFIGFRDIKVDGNRLLVNGRPVKLRGACRHDIHPTLGRTTTAQLDSLDALLFKKSNMNFVRTSHYPPSEKFLEYCDKFGIYVECETAVCFVDTYRQKNYAPANTQSNSSYNQHYLGQYKEMVNSFRSHPAIIMWSIGNESVYGENFQQCWDWSKSTDKTRPVIFSYPGSVKNDSKVYDILSMHYQDVNGNVSQWGMATRNFQGHGIPALFDEWAHPACYTYATLQEDPNIREFWGKSLDLMWSGLFDAPGGLGGATWGYIDEIFMLPKPKEGTPFWKEFAKTAKPEGYQGDCVGYGEWGIVDIWRRPKPEFWASAKAYSPVRLLTEQINNYTPGERLFVTVYNRFDHTNLNEIKIAYTYKGVEKYVDIPSIEPHQKGMLLIPGEKWENGEKITVKAFTNQGELIDASTILLGNEKIHFPEAQTQGTLLVNETEDEIIVKGNTFEIPFCKKSGLICNATSNGNIIIEKGPFVNMDINLNHLTGAEVRKSAKKYLVSENDWQKQSLRWEKKGDDVLVFIAGNYKSVNVDIQINISSKGEMNINYLTSGEPNGYLREMGLKFYIPESLNYLQWERDGYWSYYPETEFAANKGEVPLYQSKQAKYGGTPTQEWSFDTHNYFYWADAGANTQKPLNQMAKGMKENIWYYTLTADSKEKTGFSVISKDASVACRTNKLANEKLMIYVNNRWDYPEIAWGNYCKKLEATPNFGQITIVF